MPKKPVKIILKFSNNSTASKDKKGKGKPKKSASNGSPTSVRGNSGPRKLKP